MINTIIFYVYDINTIFFFQYNYKGPSIGGIACGNAQECELLLHYFSATSASLRVLTEFLSEMDFRITNYFLDLLLKDFVFCLYYRKPDYGILELWPEPGFFKSPYWPHPDKFLRYHVGCSNFFKWVSQTFFYLLIGSLLFCSFLVIFRWNIFNNTFLEKLYNKIPIYAISLFYSVLLFLFSMLILQYQYVYFFVCSELYYLLLFITDVTNFFWSPCKDCALFSDFQTAFRADSWLTVQTYYKNIFQYLFMIFEREFLTSFEEIVFPYLIQLAYAFPWFVKSDIIQSYMTWKLIVVPSYYLPILFKSYVGFGCQSYSVLELQYIVPFFREKFFIVFSLDGLSMVFIILTTFITSLCICVSWFSYKRKFAYTLIILLFVTQFLIIIVFSTLDLILFYIAFESVLIPLFFLVGIFGSRERRIKAAYYLMFYTLFGSIPFLLGLLYIWYKTGQTNILLLEPLLYGMFSNEEMTLLWFLFLPGFAFKVPLYPFHLWLPEAHVEAPTIGSVILAGLVLKLGGYGFIRFLIGFFYWGGIAYLNIMYWFCLLSMLGAVLCAACQIDLKRIIAYGSISHMGLVTLCIFLGSQIGLESAMLMMIGHGFVSSALFILVGGLYERYHSRNVRYYGGLYKNLPKFGTLMLCFVLFDIGVPGSPAFAAELLAFIAVVQESLGLAVFLSFPIIIGAGVSLLVCSRVLFGMNDSRYYLSFPIMLMNFLFWLALQKKITVVDSKTKVYYQKSLQKYINAVACDFRSNEVLVLVLLFISSAMLGIFPNWFVKYFVYDLEIITQVALCVM